MTTKKICAGIYEARIDGIRYTIEDYARLARENGEKAKTHWVLFVNGEYANDYWTKADAIDAIERIQSRKANHV